ncbi:MAG: hypothetical protein WD154_08045 [Nitrosopumilaceae archaeon]
MSQNNNTAQPIAKYEPQSNGSVTDHCNVLPRGLRKFYERAKRINQIEHRPFSKQDFESYTAGNYRQHIHRLRPYLEIEKKSKPVFYRVKGVELPGASHSVTHKPMGDTSQIIDLLESVRDQPAMIHDIKVQFTSDNLHAVLVSKGCSVNQSNHSIKVDFPSIDNNITTKILVYPKTVQVDIGCTYKPIVYDSSGVYSLLQEMSSISFYLLQLTSFQPHIPEVKDWVITQYHFNKDGSEAYNGLSFHYTIENVSNGLIRYYSKKMQDGTTIPRIEQVQTPHRTMEQEMLRVIQ